MSKNELRTIQTRGRLVAAARTLFARNGYAMTSTDAIIDEAGVTRGALYHHYRDKADLFEAVCRDLAAGAAEAIKSQRGMWSLLLRRWKGLDGLDRFYG